MEENKVKVSKYNLAAGILVLVLAIFSLFSYITYRKMIPSELYGVDDIIRLAPVFCYLILAVSLFSLLSATTRKNLRYSSAR